MSDLDLAVEVVDEFDGTLIHTFGAEGADANQRINSLKGLFPKVLIDDLHYVRLQRNALAHRRIKSFEDSQEFMARTHRVRELLLRMAVPTGDDVAFYLVNKKSGKNLDIPWERQSSVIHQWDGHGAINQQWILRRIADDYMVIISRYSGKCFDVQGHSSEDGTEVIQWNYNWGWNQHWRVTRLEDHSWKISARHSEKVLDVTGGSCENGAAAFQWPWHGGDSQRWWLSPAI